MPPLSGSDTTLLLVDDDADVRDSLQALLEGDGFTVRTAGNGREALELLEGGLVPDLIVLDLSMPVMDGPSFLAAMDAHSTLAGLRVLVVSANLDLAETMRFPQVVGALSKSRSPDALLRSIRLHAGEQSDRFKG